MKPSVFASIPNQNSGSSENGLQTDATQLFAASAQAVISGNASGSIKLQASNDIPPGGINNIDFVATNWVTIGSSVSTPSEGSYLIPKIDVCYRWLRSVWTSTSSGDAIIAEVVIQDLTYDAIVAGEAGNLLNLTYVDPGLPNQSLSILVVDNDITATLATDGLGAITTTASQLSAVLNANPSVSALLQVTISGTNSNVQAAQSQTFLAGGLDEGFVAINMKVSGI